MFDKQKLRLRAEKGGACKRVSGGPQKIHPPSSRVCDLLWKTKIFADIIKLKISR
jgi:hypothetical protein